MDEKMLELYTCETHAATLYSFVQHQGLQIFKTLLSSRSSFRVGNLFIY